jgi:hypothetical protein
VSGISSSYVEPSNHCAFYDDALSEVGLKVGQFSVLTAAEQPQRLRPNALRLCDFGRLSVGGCDLTGNRSCQL